MHSQIVDEIEEELFCELCKLRMWLPYRWLQSTPVYLSSSLMKFRLTECGHVFCLGCLLTSFDDIHTRFLNANPGYTPLSLSFKEALREPLKFPSVCYKAHVHMAKSPHPEYTCPSCQNAVTRRPVEELKVKKLVMCLSSVQGIKPPQSTITAGTDKLPFEGYHFL
jgi:hypothetical protein